MNRSIKFTCICVVIITIGIVLFCMMTLDQRQEYRSNPPVDSSLLLKSKEQKNAVFTTPDEKIAAIPSPIPTKAAPIEKSGITPENSRPLTFEIVDALNQPIDSGVVILGTKHYSFQNGSLTVPGIPPGIVQASVVSDGYQKADAPIDPNNDTAIRICLEYQSKFKIQVYWDKEFKTPAPNVRVVLRKGTGVIRPLPDSFNLSYIARGDVSLQGNLRFDGNRIQVNHAPYGPQSFHPVYSSGWSDLFTNDQIIGISGLMWDESAPLLDNPMSFIQKQTNCNSARLRIYDALLAYYSNPTGSTEEHDFLDIQRENQHLFVHLPKLHEYPIGEVYQERETGADGSCLFENLPAGSYFAQAIGDEVSSTIAFLHPAKGGEKIYLSRWFSNVTIRARLAGLPFQFAGIKNAAVRLFPKQPNLESNIQSGKTDEFGKITFEYVPFGQYLLEVKPPDAREEDIYRNDILINEPRRQLLALFKSSGYTISGKVKEIKTHDLIEGFNLQLFRTSDRMGEHSVAKSDSQGAFVFRNVPSGEYILIPIIDNENDCGVIPAPNVKIPIPKPTPVITSVAQSRFGHSSSSSRTISQIPSHTIAGGMIGDQDNQIFRSIPLDEMKVEVRDADIVNLQYSVVYRNPVTISGIVSLNNSPIENSVVRIACKNVRFIENPVLSDAQGHYKISLYANSAKIAYTARITAMINETSENDNLSMLNPFVLKKSKYTAKGIETISFKNGEKLDNVNIIIRESTNDYMIKGKIICEDYTKLDGIQLQAMQNNESVPTQILDHGEYQITNLEPGRVTISVKPGIHVIDTPHMGKRSTTEFCDLNYTLAISSIHKVVEKDLILVPATNMSGQLIQEDQAPLPGVQITVKNKANQIISIGKTDQHGYFWFWGMKHNERYSLSAISPDLKNLNLYPNLAQAGINNLRLIAKYNIP